jgi:hypothetical protein
MRLPVFEEPGWIQVPWKKACFTSTNLECLKYTKDREMVCDGLLPSLAAFNHLVS